MTSFSFRRASAKLNFGMTRTRINRRPRIGFHAPIKGGLHESLIVAKETGCDAVQLFSRNPRGWMAKPLTREAIVLFRKTRGATKLPLAVCIDTAHSFTAGYDIREEDGLESTIEIIRHTVGLRKVRAIHFNDSRAPYNSRVDRHWHIGEGHIGREALRRVAQHPKLAHAAFILETPYDDPRADLKNLETLRSFVDG